MADQNDPTCFSPIQMHVLAKREIDCQKCGLDLATRTKAYEELLQERTPVIQFWQEPEFLIGGFALTVSLTGVVICTTHIWGACK